MDKVGYTSNNTQNQIKLDFSKIKSGDLIKNIELYSGSLMDGVVIENFKDNNVLYVKFKLGFFSGYKNLLIPYNSNKFIYASLLC